LQQQKAHMVLCSITKTHFWMLILLTQLNENQAICFLVFSQTYNYSTYSRLGHFNGYTLKILLLWSWEHFLFPSLLFTLAECFPAAKWDHAHKTQHKLFYCILAPATWDTLRTCSWLAYAEAAFATEAHPPQKPGPWKCKVQVMLLNLLFLEWGQEEHEKRDYE